MSFDFIQGLPRGHTHEEIDLIFALIGVAIFPPLATRENISHSPTDSIVRGRRRQRRRGRRHSEDNGGYN